MKRRKISQVFTQVNPEYGGFHKVFSEMQAKDSTIFLSYFEGK